MQERQVIICGGPRCDPTRREADRFVQQLRSLCGQAPALPVQVVRRLCLSACEHGPTLLVEPDGVWYRCASLEVLQEIHASHLRGNTPLEAFVFHRDAEGDGN